MRKKYFILNTKLIFVLSIIVISTTSFLVFYFGHNSIFKELKITLFIIFFELFLFLFFGLFSGLRLIGKRKILDEFHFINTLDKFVIDDGFFDVEGGIIGFIISIFSWILITIVFTLLFWIFINLLWGVVFILLIFLYWLFYNAYKIVFKNAIKCKGNISKSIGYSIFYSILYTSWMYLIIFLAENLFLK